MPLPIIIVEEPGPLGPDLARFLKYRGFRSVSASNLDHALLLLRESAPKRVALFVSSSLAAAQSESFDLLLRQTPKPLIRFLCTGPLTCPVNPGLRCPGLDCIQKPLDFMAPDLAERLRRMLRAEAPPPPAEKPQSLAADASFCFARPVESV
jgi:DNA-binding response OmpR family regulator